MKSSNNEPEVDAAWWEQHVFRLGKIAGNLLSIESLARLIIELDRVGGNINDARPKFSQIREGDWVELTALSNKEDLTWALDNYNKRIKRARPDLAVDTKRIVFLRDALAHGRQFGIGKAQHLILVKYHRKSNDRKVQVLLRVDMTKEWFDEQIAMLSESLSKMAIAAGFIEKELGQ